MGNGVFCRLVWNNSVYIVRRREEKKMENKKLFLARARVESTRRRKKSKNDSIFENIPAHVEFVGYNTR